MKVRWTTLLVVVLFANSILCRAQTQLVNGIAHIALRVSDLDSSRNFFHRLGFEEAFSFTRDGKTTEVFVKVNDRQFIELYPRTDAAQPLGWMHVCYEADSLDALNALYVARGLRPSPVVKGGAGNLIFSLDDPEGRVVEFTQYLPGSMHFTDRGKHLGEHRISNLLMGIRVAIPDLVVDQKFYNAGLGFDEQDAKAGVRMRISNESHQWIELEKASGSRGPEFRLLVPNTDLAARQARVLGLAVKRQRRLAYVSDPDGNVFAFEEDHRKSPGHLSRGPVRWLFPRRNATWREMFRSTHLENRHWERARKLACDVRTEDKRMSPARQNPGLGAWTRREFVQMGAASAIGLGA